MTVRKRWIGVDLDGTLATHTVDQWSETVPPIGEPVPAMVERVERWLEQGRDVRIVTARVAKGFDPEGENWRAICKWVKEELGVYLPITAEKDPDMIELWDDRAVAVERNTGVDPRKAAFDLHRAYLRLRALIPGAFNTPNAPTPSQVWETTENALKDLRFAAGHKE